MMILVAENEKSDVVGCCAIKPWKEEVFLEKKGA
jgi:hypothetical protein